MKKNKKGFQVGDIFTIEFSPGNFVFGRILFDVKNQYLSKINHDNLPSQEKNYFNFYGDSYLVEMYKGINDKPELLSEDILIPRAFSMVVTFKEEKAEKVGFREVDFQEIGFPETLSPLNDIICLERGELVIKTSLTRKEYDEISVGTETVSIGSVAFECAQLQGKKHLIPEDYQDIDDHIKSADLYFHPEIRNKIYKQIGEDPNQSYYEMALKHGYDLARLY